MKVGRHAKILEIISKYPVETQEELGYKLKEMGFDVTQATISRDIKELRLIKVLNSEGKYNYAPSTEVNSSNNERIVNVFRESVLKVDYSGNMIVLKTLSGTAMAASAAIDSLEWTDIVGCVAGDDTIFVLLRSSDDIEMVVKKFQKLMK